MCLGAATAAGGGRLLPSVPHGQHIGTHVNTHSNEAGGNSFWKQLMEMKSLEYHTDEVTAMNS